MKRKWYLGLICCLLVLLGGCISSQKDSPEGDLRYIYYLNAEESKVVQEDCQLESSGAEGKIQELCDKIAEQPTDIQYLALLPEDVSIEKWNLQDTVLWLDFNEKYEEMSSSREILTRAGIVRTFTQLPQVEYVGFQVNHKELENSKGETIGVMNEDSFVENSGKEVNAYQYITMNLYFTNKAGDKLVKEERKVYYSKNTLLERVVVEQLLQGPKGSENYPTLPSETKILGVSIMDEIGYVNLDKTFLDMALSINEDIAIQSIVNSLTDASNVGKVQISINGDSKVEFRESISLDQLFEPDKSLVEE